jgi:hypothetical protein
VVPDTDATSLVRNRYRTGILDRLAILSEICFLRTSQKISGKTLPPRAQRCTCYLLPGLMAGMLARSSGKLSGLKVSTFI